MICDHDDAVTRIPDGATVLAGNAYSEVQALVIPTDGSEFWGVQYHPDFSVAYLPPLASYRHREWLAGRDLPLGWTLDEMNRVFQRLIEGDVSAAEEARMGPDILDVRKRQAEVAAWLATQVLCTPEPSPGSGV